MSLSLSIRKHYPGFSLDVAFEAGEERIGLLGASGCGKSCTLRCIAGVETPDEGRIVVNGVTFFDSDAGVNLTPQQRKCALLFQNYQLFPNLTVTDNVCAGMDRTQDATRQREDALRFLNIFGMGEYADLWDGFEGSENPFMANYRVVLEDLADLDAKVTELEAIPGVTKVNPPTELAGVFLGVQKAVNIAAWSLVGVLVVVSVVVISNTIRLTVFSRRKEINIMKYVGATNGFIRLPFFVEGMTSGFISGCIASAAVLGGYALVLYFSQRLEGLWETVIGASLLSMGQVWYFVVGGFLLFGVLIGSLGTAVSVRKHLKV